MSKAVQRAHDRLPAAELTQDLIGARLDGMASLPRTVFLLRHLDGLEVTAIEARLGLSAEDVERHLAVESRNRLVNRTGRQLRNRLRNYGWWPHRHRPGFHLDRSIGYADVRPWSEGADNRGWREWLLWQCVRSNDRLHKWP